MFKNKINRWFAHVCIVLTGCLASMAAWAALQPPPELLGLPWVQIGVAGIISLWGGVGRTAVRAIEDAQERLDKPDVVTGFRLKSELAKDLVVSSGIGFVVYLFGVHQDWSAWLLAPALWVAGYTGTKLLSGMSDAVLSYVGTVNKDKP